MTVYSPWHSLRPYPDFPIHELLMKAAHAHSTRRALITQDAELTFGQAWEAARRVVRLLSPDVAAGDRVLFAGLSSPAYAMALYGTMAAGATVVPVNPLFKPAEMERVLKEVAPAAAFVSKEFRDVLEEARADIPSLRKVYELESLPGQLDELAGGSNPAPSLSGESLAALVFSSGTTGSPKGVMLTHRNLVANLRQTLATGMTPPYSTLLNYMPFFHVYGFAAIMGMAFALGVPQIIIPRFDPGLILKLASEEDVHTLYAPPPALRALVAARSAGAPAPRSTRVIITGAAPTLPDLWERAEATFGIPVCQPFGLSEATAATNMNPLHRIRRGTVGPPLADTEQRIVDAETGEDLPAGKPGEVWVRGPQVMAGYWRNPEATAACITPDGWLRTGDLGVHDDEGYLTIVDRLKDMIRYKAHQVAPSDLEALLLEHPAVADVAVIPRPDLEAGEIPKACVVLAPGASTSPEELMAFISARVNPISQVRAVEFLDAIPRNPSGKVLRRELIERERARASSPQMEEA